MIILKRFYCPTCGKLKSRFEVYKQVKQVSSGGFCLRYFYCKECFNNVIPTKSIIEGLFNKSLVKDKNNKYSIDNK